MTGAKQLMQAQTLVSHNLANIGTSGFRADLARFQASPVAGAGLSEPSQHGSERRRFRSLTGHAACRPATRSTSRSTAGAGLPCKRADGSEAYTRGGTLNVNALGLLETQRGELVLGDNGPIAMPPHTQLSIGGDGTISIVPQGQGPETSRRSAG